MRTMEMLPLLSRRGQNCIHFQQAEAERIFLFNSHGFKAGDVIKEEREKISQRVSLIKNELDSAFTLKS